MPKPEMKQESELTLADFLRHPIWIGVHNYDVDEPWYEESDEETVRPWTGQLPFAETRGTALVAARFLLADGSVYPGYCCAVANDWDKPQVPVSGAPQAKALSWSAMHGGVALSILLLQSPTIFVGGRSFDFQLRVPELRRGYIREFYSALGKSPTDVFPIQFKAESGLASGIVSGTVDGFFNFPLWVSDYEITKGESFLVDSPVSNTPPMTMTAASVTGRQSLRAGAKETEVKANDVPSRRGAERVDLTLEDIQQFPVWIRVHSLDESKPFPKQYHFVPWTGRFPVDSATEHVRIPASFTLHDGNVYQGYVRAVPENWADIDPSPTLLGGGHVIQGSSPRKRFGGSPLAVVGEHQPCLFIGNRKFFFWCGPRCDLDELRHSFYEAIGKGPDDVFPIAFRGAPGYATGITSGEIEGFYEIRWGTNKAPRVVR